MSRHHQPGAEADPAIETATALALAYCAAAGGARPGMCYSAAWNIRDLLGWPIVSGTRSGLPHHWNAMPDGRGFDATAQMFGDPGPLVTEPGDDRYLPVT